MPTLTFDDWQAIARRMGHEPLWAYYEWIESCAHIRDVTLEQWEYIAGELGYGETWSERRYREAQSQ